MNNKELKRKRASLPTGEVAVVSHREETSKKKKKQKEETAVWSTSSAGGFQLVPLKLSTQPAGHPWKYLYIRQHRASGQSGGGGGAPPEDAAEAESTLFVTNVDDVDVALVEDRLRRLFAQCGTVESVTLKTLRRVTGGAPAGVSTTAQPSHRPLAQSGRGPWLEVALAEDAEARPLVFAHVAFASSNGLREALNHDWLSAAADNNSEPHVDAHTDDAARTKRGVPKWLEEYHEARPDPQRVMAEVDAFMADFDRKQRQAEREEEAALGKPDADGFVTVRRKGRKKVTDSGIPVASARAGPALAAKAQRQESDKVLLDFYRFQRRENRRKQLADLRLRFEEDKKKIAKLRAQRKFKPF